MRVLYYFEVLFIITIIILFKIHFHVIFILHRDAMRCGKRYTFWRAGLFFFGGRNYSFFVSDKPAQQKYNEAIL
jgi:hypothetical protein